MSLYQKLINFEVALSMVTEPPIFVNDLVTNTEDDRRNVENLIMTRYSGDMISVLPSCNCGKYKGEFATHFRCEVCHVAPSSSIETDIQAALWFRKPIGVEKLMNPIVWIMLKHRFKKSSYSILQWLTDRSYAPAIKVPEIVGRMEAAGIPRGYNAFVQNFDDIMTYLFQQKEFRLHRREHDFLKEILHTHRDCIFSDYLPIPNKTLFIVEKDHLETFLDPVTRDAIDYIWMLVSIDTSFHDQRAVVKENRTAKVLAKISDFIESYFASNLSQKSGQFRRHLVGSRSVFAFRAVITSITGPHDHEGMEVPWGVGITAWRPHLINKLMAYGFSHDSAVGLLTTHVGKYHPLLDQFLQELIDEAPDRKIYCLLQRNPSLLQGSAQRVYIAKFKTDPTDKTISMSILIVKAPNADFDGKLIAVVKLLKLLETPESLLNHNVVGNDKRDGMKISRIGQSAAKCPYWVKVQRLAVRRRVSSETRNRKHLERA